MSPRSSDSQFSSWNQDRCFQTRAPTFPLCWKLKKHAAVFISGSQNDTENNVNSAHVDTVRLQLQFLNVKCERGDM